MNKDFEYLYSLRKYILIVLNVFIFSLIIGLIASIQNPGLSEEYLKDLEGSFGWIKTLDPLAIMIIIFLNNALKSLAAIILGIGFGAVPLLFIIGNGIILSILADTVSKQYGTLFVIAALLPHGIIEVPMILISAGIGVKLGHSMYQSMKGLKIDKRSELNKGVSFYMRRIVPMLFIAAFIETFITPLIAFQLVGRM